MQASAEAAPVGYDLPRVEAWIAANIADLTPPLKWTRLEGGHSNLTDRVLSSVRRAACGRVAVLLHDTIPLDFPQFQRPGTATGKVSISSNTLAQRDLLRASA